jgi:hypothetical protein
LSGLATAG